MAELLRASAYRDAHVHLIAETDAGSLPVIALTVQGEFVDVSVYDSYRGTYTLEIHSELNLEEFLDIVSRFSRFAREIASDRGRAE